MPVNVPSAAQDLYKPDPTRTRRNLSAIINFAKFREEKLVPYTQLQEEIEAALEERERLEAVNLQMVRRAGASAIQLLPHAGDGTEGRSPIAAAAAACAWSCRQMSSSASRQSGRRRSRCENRAPAAEGHVAWGHLRSAVARKGTGREGPRGEM